MKRTGEVVLSIIGAIIYAFFGAIGAFMIWIEGNEEIRQQIKDTAAQQGGVSAGNIDNMFNTMSSGGWLLVSTCVIAVILGIVAMVLIKGNKKPKAAGIIFIATAVVITIVSGGAGLFGGIFYLIAGIMCLVRKEQKVFNS